MILQELNRLYDRLSNEPEIDISEPGFSKENISFKIIITPQGTLQDRQNAITDLRIAEGKNVRPVRITVPKFDGKRTSGVKPYFLWDKTDYIIGLKNISTDSSSVAEQQTPQHHGEFIRLIDTVTKAYGKSHAAIEAIKIFCLDNSNIGYLRKSQYWADFLNSFVVFEVVGFGASTVFDIKEVVEIWKHFYKAQGQSDTDERGICLVTGNHDYISKIHPTVKKGVGGKNDIPFVSCNFDAGESYNKDKNANSPISISAASSIASSLNFLLDNSKYSISIADTRTLFWAEQNDRFEDYFGEIFGRRPDDSFSADLKAFLESVRKGRLPDEVSDSSRFFILGLSPNAARISVRFWHVDTVESIARKVGLHFDHLQLIRERDNQHEYPTLWQLLIETATQHKTENIPPLLAGPLLQSILKGSRYPENILSLLINRMRTDQGRNKLSYFRAAFIKAILNRNHNKELTMALDISRTTSPYLLGRLFAILEKVQEDSSGGNLNSTIKDRFFSSASTTPRAVFPRLLSLAQNHFKKLKSDKHGLAVNREKLMGQVIDLLPPVLPATLKLEDQGEFAIGYYHQRQDFFKKKEETV